MTFQTNCSFAMTQSSKASSIIDDALESIRHAEFNEQSEGVLPSVIEESERSQRLKRSGQPELRASKERHVRRVRLPAASRQYRCLAHAVRDFRYCHRSTGTARKTFRKELLPLRRKCVCQERSQDRARAPLWKQSVYWVCLLFR